MWGDTLTNLRADRQREYQAAEEIAERAKRERRDVTPAEEAAFGRHLEAMRDLDRRIDDLTDDAVRRADADRARSGYEGILSGQDRRPTMVRPFRRSTGDEQLDEFVFGSERTLELSFGQLERRIDPKTGAYEVRDLYTGSGTGTNITPVSFSRKLYEYLIELSAIRQTNATILNTPSGEELVLPKVAAHPSGGTAIVQEGSVIPEDDPSFAQGTLNAYKYGNLVQVSSELLSDNGLSGPDLLAYLAKAFARSLSNGAGTHYVIGTGSGEPQGVIPALGTVVQVQGGTGLSGKPTADDVIDLYYKVPPSYRQNAFWLMSDSAAQSIRKLKDAEDRYIWVSGGLDASPDMLMGRPVVVDPNVPAAGTAGTSIVFGDFSGFYIRDVGNVRFERSDDFAFDRDVSTFRTLMRTDSELLDDNGIGSYVGGTA